MNTLFNKVFGGCNMDKLNDVEYMRNYAENWHKPTITLKQFIKFAKDNDILWYYNKPIWNPKPTTVKPEE